MTNSAKSSPQLKENYRPVYTRSDHPPPPPMLERANWIYKYIHREKDLVMEKIKG